MIDPDLFEPEILLAYRPTTYERRGGASPRVSSTSLDREKPFGRVSSDEIDIGTTKGRLLVAPAPGVRPLGVEIRSFHGVD